MLHGAQSTGVTDKGTLSQPPTEWMDRKPTLEASESGRANFCVIEVILSYMEWLELGFEGHTRAGYRWSEEGNQWKGCWLEP